MPYQPHNPFADILAQRDAARVSRVAPALSIPARVRDTGAPSTRATDARDERIAQAIAEAELRDARNTARRDYFAFTCDPHNFNGGRFRTTRN